MADLVVTPENCIPGADAVLEQGVSGESITAGQAVYRDPATGKWLKADNDSALPAARHVDGIAMTGSALDQPIVVQRRGSLTLGAVMTAGTSYYLSANPGGIAPVADIGAGKDPVLIGIATSAAVLKLALVDPDVTL